MVDVFDADEFERALLEQKAAEGHGGLVRLGGRDWTFPSVPPINAGVAFSRGNVVEALVMSLPEDCREEFRDVAMGHTSDVILQIATRLWPSADGDGEKAAGESEAS